MIKVRNPNPFAFDGIPARGEGMFPGDAAKARRFGLVVLEDETAPDPAADSGSSRTPPRPSSRPRSTRPIGARPRTCGAGFRTTARATWPRTFSPCLLAPAT
jgi:hypothetical protein